MGVSQCFLLADGFPVLFCKQRGADAKGGVWAVSPQWDRSPFENSAHLIWMRCLQ